VRIWYTQGTGLLERTRLAARLRSSLYIGYRIFAQQHKILALGICLPQPCSSTGLTYGLLPNNSFVYALHSNFMKSTIVRALSGLRPFEGTTTKLKVPELATRLNITEIWVKSLSSFAYTKLCELGMKTSRPGPLLHTFFLSWVAKTHINHQSKRVVSARLITLVTNTLKYTNSWQEL